MKVDIYKNKETKMALKKPLKVSVIIPNYNYENFIIERIDSILMQTYPIFELIILDDASTDHSVEVIEEKIKTIQDVKVKLIKNEVNSGGCVFAQWQKGLKNIKGDYFWIAEADDSADPKFLETNMRKFEEDPNLTLSYTESLKIDENNNIIGENCKDWCDIFHTGKWDADYTNSGEAEIKEALSSNNTILNVSSVVWKNKKEYFDIFEEAKEYHVAGDWYIYARVLEEGNIAFSSKPLNYFRKHSKSASTVVARSLEYKEVYAIGEMIREKYDLSKEELERQVMRRKFMGYTENETNKGTKGRVAWVIPSLLKGSGGHRTIIQNVNALMEDGYSCDIYVEDYGLHLPTELSKTINEYYGECHADIFNDWVITKKYDLVIATAFNTVDTVVKADAPKKLYFVQDYEPYFFSMGDYYIWAENSYKYNLRTITIGKWLTSKMQKEFKTESSYFNFCADLKVYKPLKNIEKEKSICFIFQPEKPRRCEKIALKALQIVKNIMPDVQIYLYGSAPRNIHNLDCKNLGILPIEECNELYNKCTVGLCMSASNPSRIPFEMMAAGLPVVELYKENNLYDFPDGAVLLADTTPEAVAAALLEILRDPKKQKSLSKEGRTYMKDFPLEKGFEQFVGEVNAYMANGKEKLEKVKPSYTTKIVSYTDETLEVSKKIKKDVTFTAIATAPSTELKVSLPRRVVRKAKRVAKRVIKR